MSVPWTLLHGDALDVLATLPAASVQCCITSPPYLGLRDYGVAGQIGLEASPAEYVARLVAVFREVRRVLRDDGTLWLNVGDSYNAYNVNRGPSQSISARADVGRADLGGLRRGTIGPATDSDRTVRGDTGRGQAGQRDRGLRELERGLTVACLKPKDLIGIPWRLAFALQGDGWYLRSDIIWHKPNPMPESVTDRPTRAHEYLFLLSKRATYYYDAAAIAEPQSASTLERFAIGQAPRKTGAPKHGNPERLVKPDAVTGGVGILANGRNRRSVWAIPTQPYAEAHFATMPEKLVEPCILAGSRPGDTVLDPFVGSGTVCLVAARFNRRSIGIDISETYLAMAERRLMGQTMALPLEVS
jgi:DNA modification methylase